MFNIIINLQNPNTTGIEYPQATDIEFSDKETFVLIKYENLSQQMCYDMWPTKDIKQITVVEF